ncbi:hypothetical protein CHRYSEOSP005_23280 [Chryseobacterium sp. Alg-005]|uniref:DoxX-like family protein n=1 Tax=Chryseobacterium sp. Alg-005 TaxID=3159516 RepID=UPI00355596A9
MKAIHTLLNYFIAAVWILNGLYCKVFNFVPRHQEIVARIVNEDHSRTLTVMIGLSEMVMAIWIVTGIKSRLNAVTQIIVITVMNILEFILVPDLLLWSKFNALFAFLFILLIYYNEFYIQPKTVQS